MLINPSAFHATNVRKTLIALVDRKQTIDNGFVDINSRQDQVDMELERDAMSIAIEGIRRVYGLSLFDELGLKY